MQANWQASRRSPDPDLRGRRLLIANIWAVIDAKAAVDAAARKATRSYVESQVDGTATPDAASDAAVPAWPPSGAGPARPRPPSCSAP
jgi:hypothetical protein